MIRLITILLIPASALYGESRITADNLKKGTLFKDSKSVEGVGLYCVHKGLTTGTQMVLMSETKNRILATIPILTTYSVPKGRKNWLTVKWNPNGRMVAIHDTSAKNSKVMIYRKNQDGNFIPIVLPNMLKLEAGGRIGLDVTTIISSGQEPDEWENNNLLMVKYRFRTKNRKLYRRNLPIRIDDKGKYLGQ